MSKEWIEITVVTSCEAVEAVTGIFYGTEVEGVSIIDSEDVEFKKKILVIGIILMKKY